MLVPRSPSAPLSIVVVLVFPLVACSGAAPAEDASRTSEAFIIPPIDVPLMARVAATDATVTVSTLFGPPGHTFTASLSGPSVATTLPQTASSSQFTALDECTDYIWTVFDDGAFALSGKVHTSQTGGGDCPLSEQINPIAAHTFRGVYHWRNNAAWCYESNYQIGYETYPSGQPWWTDRGYGPETSPPDETMELGFGYTHYWDSGRDPFPCQEQLVDVSRSGVRFYVDPSRARRLQTARLEAQLDSTAQSCLTELARTANVVWPVTTAESTALGATGEGWPDILGYNDGSGIAYAQPLAPLSQSDDGLISADVTGEAKEGNVEAGFAVPGDGFPDMTGQPGLSYAKDNNSCPGAVTHVVLAMSLAPITADTPLNCSGEVHCGSLFSITCDGAPEQFDVYENGGATSLAHARGAFGQTVALSGSYSGPATFEVCASDSGASRTCTLPVPITTEACAKPIGARGPVL